MLADETVETELSVVTASSRAQNCPVVVQNATYCLSDQCAKLNGSRPAAM